MVRLLVILLLAAAPVFAQETVPPGRLGTLEVLFDNPDRVPIEGQMVLATIRGTYGVNITNEDLKLRRMSDLDWMRLGQDDWSEQRIEGRTMRVMERRIAFFPTRAGTLTILPIAHEIDYIDIEGRHKIILRSDPVTLNVRPAPAEAGDGWLPARAVEISDNWSTDAAQLEDGEIAKRQVILRVLGAAPERLPEQPPMRERWLITFSPPAERAVQLTPEGPVTTLVWNWSLRPTTGELGVIPEVLIPWYDIDADEARVTRIPAAPIGFQSFADNSASSWQTGLGGSARAMLLFSSATGGALVLLTLGRGFSPGDIRSILGRWRRRYALWRHARSGNAAAFRRTAVDLIRDTEQQGNTAEFSVLAGLDRLVFSGTVQGSGPDLRQLRRELKRQGLV